VTRAWVVDVAVVAGGFLMAGTVGLATAIVATAAVHRLGRRAPAWGAVAALGIAAVTTAADPWNRGEEVLFEFAARHSLAATSARVAGVLLLVAVAAFIRAERRPRSRQRMPSAGSRGIPAHPDDEP
jgi:hypothetical protein